MDRPFERIGDHKCDWLALMAYAVVLEHVQTLANGRVDHGLVGTIGKPRRVSVRQDSNHAGRPFCRRTVDGGDAPVRDRAAHDGAMRLPRHIELGCVSGTARDLLSAVDAADGLSDGHARPPAVWTARTMARCMSSILKSLCPRPCAPCAASAAARRRAAASRLPPARAVSTWGTRQGLVPTPPRATRAWRMRPPSISAATAAE